MTVEQKKTDDEGKTIPNPEGYTIVKYAAGWVYIILFIGCFFSLFLLSVFKNALKDVGNWTDYIIVFSTTALFWIIARKITEVKVNLKLTDEGLEQIRLSGSRIYPEKRLIKWENMKSFHPRGRHRDQDFLISVSGGMNFRISVPAFFALFVRQKGNKDDFEEFRNDFWEIAPDYDVHVAFFAKT